LILGTTRPSANRFPVSTLVKSPKKSLSAARYSYAIAHRLHGNKHAQCSLFFKTAVSQLSPPLLQFPLIYSSSPSSLLSPIISSLLYPFLSPRLKDTHRLYILKVIARMCPSCESDQAVNCTSNGSSNGHPSRNNGSSANGSTGMWSNCGPRLQMTC
jgi:hypothetical protein